MNFMPIVLTLGIIAGFSLLFYGAFFLRGGDAGQGSSDNSEALEKLHLSVEEADAALSNINSVSSLIIEEIDIKYKELLFLYQMLEEKKKELLARQEGQYEDGGEYDGGRASEEGFAFAGTQTADSAYEANLEIMEIGRKMDEIRRFPKLHNKNEILELHEQGYDITEIAKELGIGKGEVKLILGLNKVGVGYE